MRAGAAEETDTMSEKAESDQLETVMHWVPRGAFAVAGVAMALLLLA